MIGVNIFTDEQIRMLSEMYLAGHSVKSLSEEFGASVTTIRRTLKKAGVYKKSPSLVLKEKEPSPGITPAEVKLLRWQIRIGSRVPVRKRVVSFDADKEVYGFAEVLEIHKNVVRTTAGDTTFTEILIASRKMRKGHK